jgi:uncharacterized membrane-anchored protein YjiN (DUF445 family)
VCEVSQENAVPKISRTAEFGREQERSLRRMKLFATGLLVLMAVIYCVCRMFQPKHPFLGFVAAFSEAGTIGALADWFAVVAIFRHPLNLPIPRTAVIPRNRDRIGESLARFFNENFLTKDLLEKRMAGVDLAGLLAAWLADERNARFIAQTAAEYAPALLRRGWGDRPNGEAGADAERPRKGLAGFFSGAAEAVRKSTFIRKVPPRFLSGLQRGGLSLYGRVLAPVGHAVSGVYKGGGHLPRRVSEKLVKDLSNPDSELVRQVADFIRNAGQGAINDHDLRERINRGLRAWISETVEGNRELFAVFISDTVRKWDPAATSRRIELHVGKDLQWIRINGTIVGGLAGLLIYLLSFLLRGAQ